MATDTAWLTNSLFEAYLQCRRKAALRLQKRRARRSQYDRVQRLLNDRFHARAMSHLLAHFDKDNLVSIARLSHPVLEHGYALLLDAVVEYHEFSCAIPAVRRIASAPNERNPNYEPILFWRYDRVGRMQEMSLAFAVMVIGLFQDRTLQRGSLLHGHDLTLRTSCLRSHIQQVQRGIEDLKQIAESGTSIPPLLNPHCEICEFIDLCRSEALKDDNLSLLSGMSNNRIKAYSQKGIFTVRQLSYTFRYRKPQKRARKPAKPHYFALQALSLRTGIVHIHGEPSLPTSPTRIYFDVETLPDKDLVYLIGALRVNASEASFRQFWANNQTEQNTIIEQFLEFVAQARDCRLYHFGSYDAEVLEKARISLAPPHQDLLDRLLQHATNVLSIVHHHIYFPTYSNRLKEIGRFVGATWTRPEASGRCSILWRESWEQTRRTVFKEWLLQYNREDCVALRALCDFIGNAMENTPKEPDSQRIVRTHELRKPCTKWQTYGRFNCQIEEFKHINECAYFDYQRQHVFVRTNKRFRAITHQASRHLATPRANKTAELVCSRCPYCGNSQVTAGRRLARTVIDLKFSIAGVKRWVIRYVSRHYRCTKCGKMFCPDGWPDDHSKYGRRVVVWCVYLNFVCKQKMYQTRDTLRDIFKLDVSQRNMYQFKTRIASEYADLYTQIRERILDSSVIHMDETSIRLNQGKGYVWVMATLDSVFYFYRESRKGDFLQEMLATFSGVLVSDFFTAYDSTGCIQQKCLLHLMRDFNEDLQRNAYDEEFKRIARDFAVLLRAIVETIDRFGLKRRHLYKHHKAADQFVEDIDSRGLDSELAQRYQKRIRKYGDRLFTFLDHDGVPWNNNNAEHAIKKFAKFRTLSDGQFTERTAGEACVLLTVLETCDLNNVDRLRFMLSGQNDVGSILR